MERTNVRTTGQNRVRICFKWWPPDYSATYRMQYLYLYGYRMQYLYLYGYRMQYLYLYGYRMQYVYFIAAGMMTFLVCFMRRPAADPEN